MRLYHVSEDENIVEFHPRLPIRKDLDPNIGLVWAVDDAHLPNFLTPRDCPRVTWHRGENATPEDVRCFFTSPTQSYAVALENKWYQAVATTTVYLYEFDPKDFELQDPVAGYYVSKTVQHPIAKYRIDDLLSELICRNVEIRFADNLWEIADRIKKSSLNWSLCRMKFAVPRAKSDHNR